MLKSHSYVKDSDLFIEVALPGVSKEEVEVTCGKDFLSTYLLTVKTTKKTTGFWEGFAPNGLEFRLPSFWDTRAMTAKMENGLLTIRVPLREDAHPRKIDIQ